MGVVYSLREIEAGTVGITMAEAEEIKARGELLYDEKLKAMLELYHLGEIAMIEPDSEQYSVNKDPVAVIHQAHAAIPDKRFYRMRIGYETEHSIGTRLKRREQQA